MEVDADAAATAANSGRRTQADWELRFREAPMYISDEEPTMSTARTHGRTNTTDQEKAAAMLSLENCGSSLLFLKKRELRPKRNSAGVLVEAEHGCKKGCGHTMDFCWLKDVRFAACEGTAQEKRAHLILLLRDGNASGDHLPIEGCTVRGQKLCTACFREVFKVSIYVNGDM
jgi:hypothetical protein